MFKRTYIYGTNPNRTVRLRPAEADAVNKLRLEKVYPDLEDWDPNQRFKTNLSPRERKIYDRAATKLNADLERNGPADYDIDTDPDETPILRLKK